MGGEKRMARAPTKKKIEDSLRKQLRAKEADVAHFEDLICDYLVFWDTKKLLQKDIIIPLFRYSYFEFAFISYSGNFNY